MTNPHPAPGRTRWGVLAAILGLPALALTALLTLLALWILLADS
ncbi:MULTISPECIES: hypothetical protein [Streptomyces]|uniref:Uncharacterized protein n=1 Tax=Streptomyces edwardsiae TaxID=3075527 RepID=A0ABU2PUH8_9ACTN|nr:MULTISPECIES: hypothetical protein [unclassified Streptomyces]MDT0395373.1 hypothetical protein [Streptomyces sp. DSM 41636]MDT0403225.1 hypothetical protein [Streptomyces sp. DSM 41635]